MIDDAADPVRVAAIVAATLEQLGVPYSIGGSLASSFSVSTVADVTAFATKATKTN